MKPNHLVLIKRLLAYGLAANLAAQPAFAQVTISQLPLASAGGNNIVPNLLSTLDNSGSMDWQFVPDYVDPATVLAVSGTNSSPNNPCMTNSAGITICVEGDPPYSAGGEFAMNGVGYDPNFSYLAGIDSNGQPHVNPPRGTLTPTTTPKDAYTATSGTIDVTTAIPDRKYCNSNNVCKRNGQDDASGNLVSGTDDLGHTMSAGQFPYRTNASNSSAAIFGLPEMMSIGSFSRSGSTITVTTVEAHGLATNDHIYVTGTGSASFDNNNATITFISANQFRYTGGSTGGPTLNGFYRKQVVLASATGFNRPASGANVTGTSTAHGLQTNDIIRAFTSNNNLTPNGTVNTTRSEEHTSELQSPCNLVCR